MFWCIQQCTEKIGDSSITDVGIVKSSREAKSTSYDKSINFGVMPPLQPAQSKN